jgi:dTDP-L-rhamnose 4-epimerase
MKILLTGSEGFIGTHVRKMLEERGDDVVRLDSLEPRVHKDTRWLEGVHVNMAGRASYEDLSSVDAIIHLAAQVGVADSMDDPLRYIGGNVRDTTQMLWRIPESNNLKRIIVASSMSVYGEGGLFVNEDERCQPESVYGLTKYDQERLVLMWANQNDVPASALRFFNTYGPGQALDNPYTGVLAIFSKRILSELPPLVYEDGQQTRDFVYVEDVARAVLCALDAEEGDLADVYNVCTGVGVTLEHAATCLARALDSSIEPVVTGTYRNGDIRHCTGNPSRLMALGWRPRYEFVDGIREYGRWLKQTERSSSGVA